jgi:ketosteroid isomerase-like protein
VVPARKVFEERADDPDLRLTVSDAANLRVRLAPHQAPVIGSGVIAGSGRQPSEVVRAYFESFRRDGLDAAIALWDPQIEWRPLGERETDGIRGDDAMRGHYAEWVDTMEDLGAEVCEVVFEDGERVAVSIRNYGRGRASGVPVSGSYYIACLVRDGRIVVGHEYATRDEAIAAAQAL